MIVLLFSLFAAVLAAPYFDDSSYQRHRFPGLRGPHFRGDVFDTENFWSEMSRELKELDDILADFQRQFPQVITSNEGIQGNDYVITIPLIGFEEKDIVVKAREGLLMVQAVHKTEGGSQSSYLVMRSLPSNVNVSGSWTYEKNVLRIVFPLTGKTTDNTAERNPETTTAVKDHSREELEPVTENGYDIRNADIDNDAKDRELMTNEIDSNSKVEATTYAVDLKNEIEFVPVRY